MARNLITIQTDMVKLELVYCKTQAWLYALEVQKHGVPLLLWLSAEQGVTSDKIDVICAEIPDASVSHDID